MALLRETGTITEVTGVSRSTQTDPVGLRAGVVGELVGVVGGPEGALGTVGEPGLKRGRDGAQELRRRSSSAASDEVARLTCHICGLRCARKSHLSRHLQTHEPKLKWTCKLCGFCTKSLKLQRAHVKGCQPSSCPICGLPTGSRETAEAHEAIHRGEWPHSCPQCGSMMPSKLALDEHTRKGEHPDPCAAVVGPTVPCPHPRCQGRPAVPLAEVKEHAVEVHGAGGSVDLVCPICGSVRLDPEEFSNHVAVHLAVFEHEDNT